MVTKCRTNIVAVVVLIVSTAQAYLMGHYAMSTTLSDRSLARRLRDGNISATQVTLCEKKSGEQNLC